MHTPYIFPSENGLRCDAHYLQANSIEIRGWFHFSVCEYSQIQLIQPLTPMNSSEGKPLYSY
ncbi:hypothetical protein [Vibrio rumoiensis]|uniref:hypothetical protein n=1 Tax=Vibrio rumoiensis TaxID=76258 RepID=UPI0009FC289F